MKIVIIYILMILLNLILPFNLAVAQVASSSASPTPTGIIADQKNAKTIKPTDSPTSVPTIVSPSTAPVQQVVQPSPIIQPTITPKPVVINNVQPTPQSDKSQTAPAQSQPQIESVQATIPANTVPEPVSVNNNADLNNLVIPTPTITVPQSVGAAVLQNIHDTTASFIKSPSTFFIAANKENFYPPEGLTMKNTILLLTTGILFIGIGNNLVKHSRQEAYRQKVKERIFYDWT
jgi:hypothetical protein